MKALRGQPSRERAFTLLEVVIVLAITALVISAVYSLAQGTLTLADEVHRAERRDTRKQAFTTFCEHLFSSLPATAALNLKTTQSGGDYLTQLELQNVSSPFDGTPNCIVTLSTQGQAGGGLRMLITCQPISNTLDKKETKPAYSVMLFDDLLKCEWRVYLPATQKWATIWTEETNATTPTIYQHPPLLELVIDQSGNDSQRQVFWIAPAQALTLLQPAALPPGVQQNVTAPGQPQVQVPGQPQTQAPGQLTR